MTPPLNGAGHPIGDTMNYKQGNLYQTLGKKAHDHVYDLIVHERMSPRKVANVFGIERNHVLSIVREIAPLKLICNYKLII